MLDERTFDTEDEAAAYLSEDGGQCFSRWGSHSSDCAPVAWAIARIFQKVSTGEPIGVDELDSAMSMVVNDHVDVESLIEEHGHVVGIRLDADGCAEWFTPS